MRDLTSAKRGAREARTLARREMIAGCKLAREAAKRKARTSCEKLEDRYIDAGVRFQGARAALLTERNHRKEMRAIEASSRARSKEDRAKLAKAIERRSESDDEVRSNIPPELAPLFEKVKRGIKGSARKSRTEEFLEYVEEHPREAWESDDPYERAAQEMEARAAHANPRRKRTKKGWSPKHAIRRYKRDHWGQKGRARVTPSTAPSIPKAPTKAPAGFHVGRFPDPKAGTRVLLGQLVALEIHDFEKKRLMRLDFERSGAMPRLEYNASGLIIAGRGPRLPWKARSREAFTERGEVKAITYRTRKGRDRKSADYRHVFGAPRPTLVFRLPSELALEGGRYRVTVRGIVG